MKSSLIGVLLFIAISKVAHAAAPAFSVCARTPQIRISLEAATGKPCHEITEEDLLQINSLSVFSQKISEVKDDDLSGLTNLTQLDLSGNEVSLVTHRMFIHSPNLISIDLNRNKIQKIETDSFQMLPSLTHLNIEENPLNQLDLKILASNLNLESLHFCPGQLIKMDLSPLSSLAKLKHLGIVCPTALEVDFRPIVKLKKLSSLQLINVRLVNFAPAMLLSFPDLTVLLLSNDKREIFQPEFLHALSAIVSKLSFFALKIDGLSNTDIQKLGQLGAIKLLFIFSDSLPTLRGLDFSPLNQVESLGFAAPNLDEVPDGIFAGMTKLKEVRFSSSPLRKTRASAFRGLMVSDLPPDFGLSSSVLDSNWD